MSAPLGLKEEGGTDSAAPFLQTHTGDYNGAGQPFECMPIGGALDAVTLQPDGSLVTQDPELQVRLWPAPPAHA